jgi:hypothetical protein
MECRFCFADISFPSVRKQMFEQSEDLGGGGFGLAVHSPDDRFLPR